MRLGDHRRWLLLVPVALSACASVVGDFTFVGSSSSSSSTSSSSSGVGGMTAATSASSTSASGSSSSGMTVSCVELATTRCTQMKACAPNLYQQTYGVTSPANDMLCASEAARICALPPQFDQTNPGVTDPVACQAALAGSCADYLANVDHPPAACLPAAGNIKTNAGCIDTTQCVAGDTCWTDGPPYCTAYCGPTLPLMDRCGGTTTNCDYRNNVVCAANTCTTFASSGAGETCVSGTCASGLICNTATTTHTCVSLLAQGAQCNGKMFGGANPCDGRIGLQCIEANPTGATACEFPYVVAVGATCGEVTVTDADGGSTQQNAVCDSYSYCSESNVCTPKATLDEPCTDSSVCYPGYVCTAATCQVPPQPMDPTCTPELTVPTTSVECGASNGGLPIDCGAIGSDGGVPCCVGLGNDVGPSLVTTACGTAAGCPSGGPTYTCTDSAECGSGQVCCLNYPSGSVGGSCVTGTSCPGTDWEICRMDNPKACPSTGGGCLSAQGALSLELYLPTNVGFCSSAAADNVCNGPNFPCSVPTQCCSTRCIGMAVCE